MLEVEKEFGGNVLLIIPMSGKQHVMIAQVAFLGVLSVLIYSILMVSKGLLRGLEHMEYHLNVKRLFLILNLSAENILCDSISF